MEMSESINELFNGMFLLKGKLKQPKFDAVVEYPTNKGVLKFEYATLKAIEEAIRLAAQESKSGIDFQQEVINEGNTVSITTMITHLSGQWIKHGPLVFPSSGQKPQGLGSLITYAKRYAVSATFGIAADKDDDGQGMDEQQEKQNNEPQQATQPILINGRQLAELKKSAQTVAEISGAKPDTVLDELVRIMKIKSADSMETKDFSNAKKQLHDWEIFYANQKLKEQQAQSKSQNNDEITWGQ